MDDTGNLEVPSAGVGVTVSTTNTYVAGFGFDEGTGITTADSSGKGNTGNLTATGWVPGKFGSGLSFNGTNAWVTVADSNSLDLTAAMTLEVWVKPTALSGWQSVVLKESPSGLAYSLYANDGVPRPAGYVHIGTADIEAFGNSQLALNTWTHLAATYDGSLVRMYVNGNLTGSTAATGNMAASTDPMRIGGNSSWGEYFNGVIDEVRVYSRALPQSEIQANMNTPVSAPDTTPPTVSMSAPADNATVSGAVTLSASASDNVGVAGVQFKLDGANLGRGHQRAILD